MSRLLICAFLCLLFYSSAKADTFRLTSGSITTSESGLQLSTRSRARDVGITRHRVPGTPVVLSLAQEALKLNQLIILVRNV